MTNLIATYLSEIQMTVDHLVLSEVELIVQALHHARMQQRTIFLCGNGGSAATASHWAIDLCKGTARPGLPRIRAHALTDNVPTLTAWANDTAYENIFAEQLANWMRPLDVVIGISGSGNSPNVLNALKYARTHGAQTIGLTGFEGGQLKTLADLCVIVPSHSMEQIEDVHMILTHSISTGLRQLANDPLYLPPSSLTRSRAVFLDRDGVINHNRVDYVKSWKEFRFLDGTLEALARLAASDFKIVVTTNQSAIGRQIITQAAVEEIHRRMVQEIEQSGGRVHHVAYCPHHPHDNCACRKPRPGLLLEAGHKLDLDLTRSFLIGDSIGDIEAGIATGSTPLLVRTGLGQQTLARLPELNGHRPVVVDNLSAAVEWILKQEDPLKVAPN